MTRDGSRPERVGGILEAFLEKKGLRAQVRRQEVLEDWAERVGDRIAAVTRPRAMAEGTLFVEVRSSAWLMELNMMKGEILARVNDGRDEAPVEKLVLVLSQEGRHQPPDRDV